MAQQEIGWGIEAKLLAQIKSLIARNGGSSVAFLQYPDATAFPPTGQSGAIYLALDTNKIYYWDGSGYVEMAGSGSSVVSYPSLASFPTPGSTGIIYIALDTNRLYRWDSGTTSYIEVSPATDAIVVLGGGAYSSLRCGSGNATTGNYSTAFGRSNTASGPYTSIFGQCNTASGVGSTVMAGFKNQAQGSFSTIGGGICNNACNVTSACLATGAAVLGGIGNNTSNGTWDLASCSFLTPPTICDAGAYSTIGGGFQNKATGGYTTVFGGYNNTASGLVSAVGGGTTNQASGACSFIGGGKTNTSSGAYSAILAGKFNDTNNFADAMIIGSNLTASQACTTFVNNISVDTLVPGSAVCVTTNKVLTTYSAISGSGTAGQITYWSGTSAVTGSSNLFWDNTNGRLGIGTSSPATTLQINGIISMSGIRTTNTATSNIPFGMYNTSNVIIGSYMNFFGNNFSDANYRGGFEFVFDTSNSGAGGFILQGYNGSTYTRYLKLFSNGNLMLQNGGTFTDGGQRLQVIGDAFIKGSGNTSATTALTVQNSDAAATFSVLNNGMIRLGSSSLNPLIFPQTNIGSSPSISGTNLSFYSYTTSQSASLGRFWFGGDLQTQTSGDNVHLYLSDRFSPTSGTATKSTLSINPIINQTGGANGITRGLYVNPALTAAADFRAIETTAGNVLFGSNFFWDNTNGRLGIGTSSPGDILDIRKNQVTTSVATTTSLLVSNTNASGIAAIAFTSDGTTRQGGLQYNNTTGQRNLFSCTYTQIPYYFGTNNLIRLTIAGDTGNVMINTTTDGGERLQVIGSMRVGTTAASAMYWDDTNARLGIGTSSPTTSLQVNGSITASAFIFGNSNLITGGTGTATTSIGIGRSVLQSATTGDGNTVVGYISANNLTTGSFNSIFGNNAGQAITSGSYNVILGQNAANLMTTGNNNVAIGWRSLYRISTASNNVGIGYGAGQNTGTGLNSTSSNSIYIGYNTRAATDGDTNETVIGYDAVGNGSNTTTIGNSSILSTYLAGRTILSASTTTRASLNVVSGTAPTSPNDGDIWYDGTNIYIRVGTTTKTFTII